MKWAVLFLFLLRLTLSGYGQSCDATLCGTVTDAATGKPIAYAEVFFQEGDQGTITDEAGKFHFHGLCEGTYTIVSQHIGCPHVAKEVYIRGNVEVNFSLSHEGLDLEAIVVEARQVSPVSTQTERVMEGVRLASSMGQTLGDAVAQLPGVTSLRTGSSIVKPVIRGLHSNRVLLLNNGVRQEGQQWGQDHGPEIDPYLAGALKVVMGASSVRYGSDALGGVILVEPKPLREQPGLGGEINLSGSSNGRVGVMSGMLDGKLGGKIPLSGRLQGTFKRGGNIRTPDYFLQNTGAKERNASAALAWQEDGLRLDAFYSLFYTDIGILEDAHIGNLTDLQLAIDRGRPLDDGSFTYELSRPFQRVVHHFFKGKAAWQTGEAGTFSLVYARQFNRRQEFDAHRPSGNLPDNGVGDPEMEFEITTHTVDAEWTHRPFRNLSGTVGTQWMKQVNTTDLGGLIPDYKSDNLGVFWIERWRRHPIPFELEAGIRYDTRMMDIQRRGNDVIDQQLDFHNLSGSFGFIYQFPKYLRMRFNIGTAWRAPSVNELYSEGVHHGSAAYETGSSDLKAESALNASLTADLQITGAQPYTGLTGSIAFFRNSVDRFIYLEPQEKPVLTIRGAFPAFRYTQADALLTGFDWNLEWKPLGAIGVGTGGAVLRARNKSSDEWLVYMPSDRFRHSLSWYPDIERAGDDTFIRLLFEQVLKQDRVPQAQDFAPAPEGYTLFGLEGGAGLKVRDRLIRVGFTLQNLFNVTYRDYLDRLRYFAAGPGRNVSVRISIPLDGQTSGSSGN